MAEKEACGIKYSTWAKIINMVLGLVMIVYGVLTLFTVALDVFDASPILVISFKIYEV